MANNLKCWTFTFVGLLMFSAPALALDNYKEFKRDHWDFELSTQFFRSDANYPSSGGSSQKLANGNYYQLWDVNFATRYMPRQTWSMFAWGTVGNAESNDSVAKRSNSTISQAAAGADFLIYNEAFQLVPEVVVVLPFEKVNTSSDTVLNSEGVIEVRSRLNAQKDFGAWRGYGWLGFNYRGEGRSFLLPWGLGTQFKFNGLRLGAELVGYQSVSDDTDANSLMRTSYINGVNAGSLKFYGVNPSLMETLVYGTWQPSKKWSLQAHAGTTLMGSNSAAGYYVGGFVRYSFDLTEGYTEEVYQPISSPVPNYKSNMYDSEISSENKVQQFREETRDGVDQRLFKPQPTKRPKSKKSKSYKKLDNPEFNVQLKSKKKKVSRD